MDPLIEKLDTIVNNLTEINTRLRKIAQDLLMIATEKESSETADYSEVKEILDRPVKDLLDRNKYSPLVINYISRLAELALKKHRPTDYKKLQPILMKGKFHDYRDELIVNVKIGDIAALDVKDLTSVRNFGKVRVEKLCQMLTDFSLEIGDPRAKQYISDMRTICKRRSRCTT